MSIKIQPQSRTETAVYNRLKGADFSQDALLCDRSHAAYALNIVADKGGLPEKRLGWRITSRLSGTVYNLYTGEIYGKKCILAHAGETLYRVYSNSAVKLCVGLPQRRCAGFFMDCNGETEFFMLAGERYISYNGLRIMDAVKVAFVPVVVIGKAPTGGGVALQPVNLITPKRTEKFTADGSSRVYQLSANELDDALVVVKKIVGAEVTDLREGTDFSVNRRIGQLTFVTAPPATSITGEDNIFVTYSKTVEGYASRILSCTVFSYFGLGGANRVFVTGNPSYPAWDWWSEMSDPTYFPDLNYSILGSDNARIMGYSKIGEYLVVIKEDNCQDSTIFIRSAELSDGKASFPVRQGVTGVGAVAPNSFVNLIDEPLFLSRRGVYAVTSNMITAERTLKNRSHFLDGMLCKEENLKDAVAVEWNGYYMVCVNDRAYLLDSRQRARAEDGSDGFIYEGYLWDNIPAKCLLSVDGVLYFGTAEGYICRFNNDIKTANRYNDDGKAITAIWETTADNDGMAVMYKTMLKKGSALTIKPSVQTGADIYVSKDGEPFELLCRQSFALFTWENIDFGNFTFYTSETPKLVLMNKKIKKYISLQFRIVNDKVNQSFGLYELTRSFMVNGYCTARR